MCACVCVYLCVPATAPTAAATDQRRVWCARAGRDEGLHRCRVAREAEENEGKVYEVALLHMHEPRGRRVEGKRRIVR